MGGRRSGNNNWKDMQLRVALLTILVACTVFAIARAGNVGIICSVCSASDVSPPPASRMSHCRSLGLRESLPRAFQAAARSRGRKLLPCVW